MDGDTISVGTEVRCLNIVAPEPSGPLRVRAGDGLMAKERPAALVRSGPLDVEHHSHDHCRQPRKPAKPSDRTRTIVARASACEMS
jgi:hypothetical protein